MGLMYIFPTSDDQSDDRVAVTADKKIILKTYGLPMLFWGYFLAIVAVIAVMYLASHAVILKLLSYQEDPTMVYLGLLVKYTLLLSPLVLLAFFFYEKNIIKKELELTVVYKVFFLPFWKKSFKLKEKDAFVVNHFLDSPNMAKIRKQQGLVAPGVDLNHFENKGYFELLVVSPSDEQQVIDRHSRKIDLVKIKETLSKY
jgi:hypothetical protein